MTIEADYLVKGCGASAMSFVDGLLHETDATIAIVDRRAAPGGHWNDVYPFVRLHQPSACYGVASRALGHDRKDVSGFNQGLYELASGLEVADYFHQVMRDAFLPTGRVSYHPVSELVGDEDGRPEIVSLLSGKRRAVNVRRKRVDATLLNTVIPLTHTRKFEVAPDVACIPPNDLARLAPGYRRFTVLGAGKTAIDSLSWLLANGAPADAITWVMPRDPWLFDRANLQPGDEFFDRSLGSIAAQYEACAAATSIQDLCERMEAAGVWLRLDAGVWPQLFHGATVTRAELDQLRRIPHLVRMGRVRCIDRDRLVLDGGEMSAVPGALYVDCTASALAGNVRDTRPVFSDGLIRLQMIRQYQPTFSAALIAHIEATMTDEADKQKLTAVTPMTDTVEDWAAMMPVSMANQSRWMSRPELAEWILGCRLDLYARTARSVRPDDAPRRAILGRMQASGLAAAKNLARLSQAASA